MSECISVIIPIYNVEQYLEKCLDSVISQTYQTLEIILVDDGSTDRSPQICDEYAKLDKRIHVIHQKNKGLSGARNTGIRQAKGDYVTYLDSDDYIHPEAYQTMYDNLIKEGADISLASFTDVYDSDHEYEALDNECTTYSGHEAAGNFYHDSSLYLLSVLAWNKLIKRELLSDFSFPEGKIHEDEYTSYKLLYSAKSVVYSKAVLYYYRQRKDSIMGQGFNIRRLELLDALEEAIKFYQENQETELAGEAATRYLNVLMSYYGRMKEDCKEEKEKTAKLYERFLKAYKTYKDVSLAQGKRRFLYYCFAHCYGLYRIIVAIRK